MSMEGTALVRPMTKAATSGGTSADEPVAATTRLTGDEVLDALVAAHPALRLSLMSYGMCTCCSGSLTLRQNAVVRGLPLGMILDDLNREIAKGA